MNEINLTIFIGYRKSAKKRCTIILNFYRRKTFKKNPYVRGV